MTQFTQELRPAWPGIAALAVTVCAWASAFPFIKVGLYGFEPLPLASARFTLAASIAAAWLLVARPRLPSLRDLAYFTACGAVGIAFYNALLNTGQQTVSAGAASFLINTSPIITALLAAIFLREAYDLSRWIGSAVAFAGVALIAAGQAGGLSLGAGASLVLAAAACQATYFIIQRPLVPRYGAVACTAYTMIAGALLLSPWLGQAAATAMSGEAPSHALWAVVGLAVIPSAIGYGAWTYALNQFGAARAANSLNLVPPAALLIAFATTGEAPSLTTIVGGGLAVAGVLIVNLRVRVPAWPRRAAVASN